MLKLLISYFTEYGYYFLFLATLLENIPIIGVLTPGEVVVVAAGFFAASGEFDIAAVIAVSVAGAAVGTNIGYFMGRHGGRPLIEKLSSAFHLDGDKVRQAEAYFDTKGPHTVFFGRYVAGAKAMVAALAGAAKMKYWLFSVYALLGIISWTLLASLLGYFFGSYWQQLIFYIKAFGWLLFVVGVSILAWRIYRGRVRDKKR